MTDEEMDRLLPEVTAAAAELQQAVNDGEHRLYEGIHALRRMGELAAEFASDTDRFSNAFVHALKDAKGDVERLLDGAHDYIRQAIHRAHDPFI